MIVQSKVQYFSWTIHPLL